jgi:hypothetical protein
MLAVNYNDPLATALQYAEKYQAISPFPNFYLDNFFEPFFLEQELLYFPNLEKLKINYRTPIPPLVFYKFL